MFGQLLKILEHAKENEYAEVIEKVSTYIVELQRDNEFLSQIISSIKEIVYEYRNKGSHTEQLNEEDLARVKEILFKEDGLYERLSKIKAILIEKGIDTD